MKSERIWHDIVWMLSVHVYSFMNSFEFEFEFLHELFFISTMRLLYRNG